MQTKFYEVEIRFIPPDAEKKVYFNFYFQCHPTVNDVQQIIHKNIATYASTSAYLHALCLYARNVIMDVRGPWFTVGECGGRISNSYYGYVSVIDHPLIDNNAAIG